MEYSNDEIKENTRHGITRIIQLLESKYPKMKLVNQDKDISFFKIPIPVKKIIGIETDINISTSISDWDANFTAVLTTDVSENLTGQQLYNLLCKKMLTGGIQIINDNLEYYQHIPIYGLIPDMAAMVFADTIKQFAEDAARFSMEALAVLEEDDDEEEEDDSEEDEEDDEQPEVSMADIFRLTPKTNCKDCGCPSCMIFAKEVLHGNITINQCPYIE